jgi:hypothetical protein
MEEVYTDPLDLGHATEPMLICRSQLVHNKGGPIAVKGVNLLAIVI